MFIGFFLVYAKLRRLDQTTTKLVRALAINEATMGDEPSGAQPPSTER
jgi:hypothetical protein